MKDETISSTELFRVPISLISKEEAVGIVTKWIAERPTRAENRRGPKVVVTPNPEMIVAAQKDPGFLRALQSSDLAIADGWGIVLALRAQSSKFKVQSSNVQRISGIELMEKLISEAAREGWNVMLLGGKPGVAEMAARKLQEKVSEVSNVPEVPKVGKKLTETSAALTSDTSGTFGTFLIYGLSGPQDISHASRSDLDNLITAINSFSPDLLFVAFGHGKQEKWLSANRYRLHAGVAMGVGGALDQIVDPTLRVPRYIDSIWLGWLYRLIREPRRWRRQLALIEFVKMVISAKLQSKGTA